MRPAPALLTLPLLLQPIHANAGVPAEDQLCNEGRTVCVAAATENSLVTNPVRLQVHVNSPDWVELEWEIRDDSGKRIDWNGTKGRMDWPTQNPSPQRTLHILDFILTTAASDHGTITIAPKLVRPNIEPQPLPILSFPVRLTRKVSNVTISVPADPAGFDHEFWDWWFDTPGDPKKFRTNINFKRQELEVMQFAPDALIGITAAAVLTPKPAPGLWQVFGWHRAGTTAHVTIDGSAWAGVANWYAMTEYLMYRSMLAIPGIHNLVLDRPERLRHPPKAYN